MKVGGHLVEGGGELPQLVPGARLYAVVEISAADPARTFLEAAHRAEDSATDQNRAAGSDEEPGHEQHRQRGIHVPDVLRRRLLYGEEVVAAGELHLVIEDVVYVAAYAGEAFGAFAYGATEPDKLVRARRQRLLFFGDLVREAGLGVAQGQRAKVRKLSLKVVGCVLGPRAALFVGRGGVLGEAIVEPQRRVLQVGDGVELAGLGSVRFETEIPARQTFYLFQASEYLGGQLLAAVAVVHERFAQRVILLVEPLGLAALLALAGGRLGVFGACLLEVFPACLDQVPVALVAGLEVGTDGDAGLVGVDLHLVGGGARRFLALDQADDGTLYAPDVERHGEDDHEDHGHQHAEPYPQLLAYAHSYISQLDPISSITQYFLVIVMAAAGV